ncbi:hypothetical protein [Hahella ganghwensis]|uniref:3'-5' exonuclease n=1 Tax=Hahella ganghwensis TaxID=286420 RepID=UPI00037C141C|nr:hypothetical protein [Hahella ganghwensis]
MNINIIDIEASGLHFDSYPIEVAVLVNGKTKSWLIKPEPGWVYWCDIAESIHGITREMLHKEGLPAIQVARELSAFMNETKEPLYSDAVRWDSDWVDTLYLAANDVRRFHMASIYKLLRGSQKFAFDEQIAILAESGKYRRHRAEEDVRMIHEAFNSLIH